MNAANPPYRPLPSILMRLSVILSPLPDNNHPVGTKLVVGRAAATDSICTVNVDLGNSIS